MNIKKKEQPHFFYGNLSLIKISKLPIRQAQYFSTWVSEASVLQITLEGAEHKNLVEYEEYEYWFETFFNNDYNSTDSQNYFENQF